MGDEEDYFSVISKTWEQHGCWYTGSKRRHLAVSQKGILPQQPIEGSQSNSLSTKSGVPSRRYSGSNFGISYSIEWSSFDKFVLDSMLFGREMEWVHLQFSLCGLVTTWWVLVMVSMHSQYLVNRSRLAYPVASL